MHEKRIQNILLVIVATLLLINFGVRLAPTVHAIPQTQVKSSQHKIQYKVVQVTNGPNQAARYQQMLDDQSEQGWEYVDGEAGLLIFKR